MESRQPSTGGRGAARLWVGNLVLLALSVLLSLGLIEAALRIARARRPPVTTGEQAAYSQWDPLLGWRNRPDTTIRYSRREYRTEVTINSMGFRDVEHRPGKTPGFGRILALGDSFVEGFTVELEQSMTRRAEAISLSEGCRLDVVNAGVHAYSTDQEALWFVRDAEPLAPDVVLIFVYYNDILNNVRGNYWGSPKPITKVVDGRLVAVNLPLPQPVPSGPQVIRPVPTPAIEGSLLKALVMERLFIGVPGLRRLLEPAGSGSPNQPDSIPDELRAYKIRGQLSEFREAWESTRVILGSLANTVRARHATPVLVHVPARFEVSERDWALTTALYGLDPSVWDKRLVKNRLEEIAASEGWAFLDLTAALTSAASVSSGGPYFQYDGHWNALGHDVVARAVVGFLRERSLLPCGRGTAPQVPSSPPLAPAAGLARR